MNKLYVVFDVFEIHRLQHTSSDDRRIYFLRVEVEDLHQYYQRYNDTRADKFAKYFKYGTDDETEIWMLRYGMSFDDIAEIKPYVISINEQELILSEEVRKLLQERLSAVERYMVTED